jgi:uncharacterized protein YjcR
MIENIAKKVVRQETIVAKQSDRQLFSETFGVWEDDRTEQEIIDEIYDSRNSNLSSL